MRGSPWNPTGDPEKERSSFVRKTGLGPGQVRRMYITAQMIQEHGMTADCHGCSGKGLHTSACRARFGKIYPDKSGRREEPVLPVRTGVQGEETTTPARSSASSISSLGVKPRLSEFPGGRSHQAPLSKKGSSSRSSSSRSSSRTRISLSHKK